MIRRAAFLALFAAVASGAGAEDLAFAGPDGAVLTIGSGRTATRTPTGFVVGLADNGKRRHPVEITVEIVAPPPAGLARCSIWRAWPRCAWTREEGSGSSGDAITLTLVQRLDGRFVRFRQTRFADGLTPAFELLAWLEAGDLAVRSGR